MKEKMTVLDQFPNLPNECNEQLEVIKNFFKNEVLIEIENDLNSPIIAQVKNSVPIIAHEPNIRLTLGNIIHETWHLYIKACLEISNYNFSGNLEFDMINYSGTEEKFADIWFILYSTVEHFYFLDKIDASFQPYSFLSDSRHFAILNDVEMNNYNIQKIALTVLQLLILKNATEYGQDELSFLETNYPSAFNLGEQMFNLLKSFNEVDDEPQIMQELFKLLWSISGSVSITRINKELIFAYIAN